MIVSNIQDKDLLGVKFVDDVVSNKKVVGSFVKNTGELTILNLNHVYDELEHTYVDIEGFGTWYINELKTDEEVTSSSLSLYDITHKFDVPYKDNFSFPATMGAWATWIGEQVGIPLKGTFLNYDKVLTSRPYIGENPMFRDAVKLIAKYASSYAQKNYDNTFSVKWFDNTLHEIEDWESFVHGKQKLPVNIIILSTGSTEDNVKWPQNTPLNPHELRIEDDWNYIDRYEINEAIYNQVNGFLYTPISKLNLPYGIFELRAGQRIKTQDIELQDIESYISKHTLEWQGGEFDDPNAWLSSIEMSELDETSSDYKKASSFANRMLNVERSCDKNEGLIRDLIQETTEATNKTAQFQIELGKIQGLISESVDTTKSSEGTGTIILENINQSEPVMLQIYPTSEDISYLYPNDDLYPSDNLFLLSRSVVFENTTTSEKLEYELPCDLLRCGEIYDEFTLDLKNRKCTVSKKIEVNSFGEKYILDQAKTKEFEYPTIKLEDGNYKIYLLSFNTAHIFCRLMTKNVYTEQFATNISVESAIEQLRNSITIKLNQTLSNYSTTTEMNSAITLKTNEINNSVNLKITDINKEVKEISGNLDLKIDEENLCSILSARADEISFEGNRFSWSSLGSSMTKEGYFVTGNAEIGGFDINKTQFSCEIKPPQSYSESDYQRMQQILNGSITANNNDYAKYDFDKNGKLDSKDLLKCRQAIICGISNSSPGKLLFDTSDWFAPIKIVNSSGEMVSSFGPFGTFTYYE